MSSETLPEFTREILPEDRRADYRSIKSAKPIETTGSITIHTELETHVAIRIQLDYSRSELR